MSKKEKIQSEIKESAQKIWLAGLGALAIAEEEGSKIFKTLVEKGETFESTAREKMTNVKSKVNESKAKVEEKVDKMEEMVNKNVSSVLGKMGVPTRDEINQLTKKVEELMGLIADMKKDEAGSSKESTTSKSKSKKAETPQ
ncbi:MAG: phasin family protein [Acidobacteria bacterium]|nr:phasin family protein [Acidobacteriota bacterium]